MGKPANDNFGSEAELLRAMARKSIERFSKESEYSGAIIFLEEEQSTIQGHTLNT